MGITVEFLPTTKCTTLEKSLSGRDGRVGSNRSKNKKQLGMKLRALPLE